MRTFKVFDISYDTDGNDVELPDELLIEVPDDLDVDEILDYLCDKISDITEYCHHGFNFTFLS